MVIHLENFETAAIFVAQRRSEGYFARTLDSNVSHLWGPLPVIGARVVISEEPIDDAPPAPPIIWSRYFMPGLNILALAWILAALLILLGIVLKPAQDPGVTMSNHHERSLIATLGVIIICPFVSLVSLVMIRATRHDRLRQPGEVLSPPMAIIAIILFLSCIDNPLVYLLFFIFA